LLCAIARRGYLCGMHGLFRFLRGIVLGLLALALLAAGAVGGLIWLALPGGDMTAAIPGLSAPVDIRIDPDGIPRIRAANRLDAAAALGFAHARERLFQMDLMRRAASGELSEIAGPATLPLDRMMRTLGVRHRAEADLAGLPADVRDDLEAYARGVNAWIAARGRLSAEEFVAFGTPAPWTPVDSLLWGKTMGLYLSGNWRDELARETLGRRMSREAVDALWPRSAGGSGQPAAALVPDPALGRAAARLAAILPRFPDPFTLPSEASNEWAVDGRHSTTGAPLLAGDPHLGFSLPGVWYLARIEMPEGTLAGATAPGVPFLVLGHNGHIAWTFTTTGSDVQDLFIETPAGEDEYQTPDGPRHFTVRQERIRVWGQPDELWTVRETRHGPLVSDLINRGGPLLAVSMANLMPGDTAAAGLMALNAAGTVSEAGRAAERITSPNQNLLVADRDGIGLFVTGRVPVRRAGDGGWPVEGADGAYDWIGWASGDQLPHVVAPASGRIVNANERIAPPDFPVFMGATWFGDERARRIRALLDSQPKSSPADFARMQVDATSMSARDLLPRLLKTAPVDADSKAALALLATWDGSMAVDTPQPLIFNAWVRGIYDTMLTTAGVPGRFGRGAAAPWPELLRSTLIEGAATAELCGGDCDKILADTLRQSTASLIARYGGPMTGWKWGDMHEAVFAHPLLRIIPVLGGVLEARIRAPGDDTTIDRGGLAPDDFTSVHGASFRGVYDLADLEKSRFVVAPGQSGHVLSRLARNFVQRWRDGDTIDLGPAPATADVTLRLVPGGPNERP
jgi:penicillin amidase